MRRNIRHPHYEICSDNDGMQSLDIRSLKTTMGMEMLRSKRPDTVRQEIAMHLLAYNLIRGVMAEAARGRDVQPRELSFNRTGRPFAR